MLSLRSIDELTSFVHQKICEFDNLDPVECPLHHADILRGGRPCGLLFQVKGPRMLKCHAVWVAAEKRILFYNSSGERVAEMPLKNAPRLAG